MQLSPFLRFAGALSCVLSCSPVGVQCAPPPSELIPDRAVVCLEILKPDPVLNTLLGPEFAARLKALPGYEALVAGPKLRDLRNAALLLEGTFHTNWQSIVKSMVRQNAALALGEGNRHLLVLTGEDPGMLQRLHDLALQIARSEADKRGQADQVRSMEYAGLTGWTFNGKEAHVVAGNQVLTASDAQVLKAAVDLRDTKGAGSLAARADYKAARVAAGPEAIAMLFLDAEKLRGAPGFKAMLAGQRQNPLAALLSADLPGLLEKARWLALAAYAEPGGLVLRGFSDIDQPAGGAAAFAQVKAGAPGLAPSLSVPGQIATLNLHRDLAGFYAAKDALFPERTSGLIFFENMMGIFFSGRNLTDEVLAELEPQIQMVVARQSYDRTVGVPDPQLPAFALIVKMRHPEKFGEVVEEAWQKALGLINFTRGQKAQPGLILDRSEHQGHKITLASFSAKEVEDRSRLDTRFNFRPSLTLARGYAVLSSTDQLARDLLEAVGKTPSSSGSASPRSHSVLRLTGQELATILRANRATLVRGNMVKEGKSQKEAEASIDNLIALIGWFEQANLATGNVGGAGQFAEARFSFSR
jgi:hypothetical protein